jgi:hypothetical protein
MSFAHPIALLLLLLLIPVGLLYWLRMRVPRVVVGTELFWQQALAEESFRARWQCWRTPVSLVLQSLIVILSSLAAAGPQIPAAQRIVLILDNSATMRAADVQPSRFDAAKEAARRLIASLRWCDEMAIVTTSPTPLEIQPLTSKQSQLQAAVGSAKAHAGPPAIDWAVIMAREIGASRKSPGRIVLITDAVARDEVRNAQAHGVEVLRIGKSLGNRAITCFTARRSKADPAQCQVFMEVQNQSDQSAHGTLDLSIDGKATEMRPPFTIEKDGRWQHLLELKLPAAARLTASVTPGDAYPFDDTVEISVPAPPSTDIAGRPLAGGITGVDIRVPSNIGNDASTTSYASPPAPLWIPLAAAGALLLIFEACLYQRRWTS